VGIQNPGNVTSPVIGWQLGLTIVAQGGAAGTLDFASFAPPSNYLFATDSGGMIRLSPALPFASIIVNDVATDNGVVVPATGDNLLALTFSITAGTHGTFNIEAVGNATSGSGWIPNVAPFPTNAFDNVPFGNTPVTIGTVTVTPASVVPEPQSAVLLMSGLVTLLAWRRVRRGRR